MSTRRYEFNPLVKAILLINAYITAFDVLSTAYKQGCNYQLLFLLPQIIFKNNCFAL